MDSINRQIRVLYLDNGTLADLLAQGPVGGGTRSNARLLEVVAKAEKTEVAVATVKNIRPNTSAWNIHSLNSRIWGKGLIRKLLTRYSMNRFLQHDLDLDATDVLVATTDLTDIAVNAACTRGWKTCSIIRAFEYLCIDGNMGFFERAHDWIEAWFFRQRYLEALRSSNLVITNSHFMQSYFAENYGIQSEVVYPPVQMPETTRATPCKIRKIGIVNPAIDKGYSVVKAIAERLPSIQFCYFGEIPSDAKKVRRKFSNIEFHGWSRDVSQIYKCVDLMLVPSQWAEPFGRIPVESIAHGVLPIVSKIGGLPETVDQDERLMVDPHNDVEAWVQKIEFFMKHPEKMASLVHEHTAHIRKFGIEIQGKRFTHLIQSLYDTP
jgi:glycosyltransferase involved in cell wall biosynthesis